MQYPTIAIDPRRSFKCMSPKTLIFHILPDLLDSRAAMVNSYTNACVPMEGGSLYHFYDSI